MDWKHLCQLRKLPCLLVSLLCLLSCCDGIVRRAPLPKAIQDCYNAHARTSLRDVVGQTLSYYCEERNIDRNDGRSGPKINNPSANRYINRLLEKIRRPNLRKCIRREYRTLSDYERNRFHRAINTLKSDTTVVPNKYDAIAALHTGDMQFFAHGGANFLSYHRFFVLVFETGLREVHPDICVPYWASSMDNELPRVRDSPIFGPDFMGGGFGVDGGVLTDGPFAGWRTPFHGPLFRNIGGGAQLFNKEAILDILTRNRTSEISPPTAIDRYNLELRHTTVHNFVGGQFLPTQSAAFDPIFFIHHCFVDYIWEMFRRRQRRLGIDPQFDYPVNPGSALHDRDQPLGIDPRRTTSDGYLDDVMASYDYADMPSCNANRPICGQTPYLTCDVKRWQCLPVNPMHSAQRSGHGRIRMPRAVHQDLPRSIYPSQSCNNRVFATQNSFCIDGICDMRNWVYVAVKVVTIRSPAVKDYGSYPVLNGRVSKRFDIYKPSAYSETNQFSSPAAGYPKGYDKCDDDSGMGQIFVQSTGINYEGFYKESALVDQRLAMAMSVAYVAVKNPKGGPVRALFRAFDSCGRICRPACKVPGQQHYTSCEGVLDIIDIPPKQYSRDYGQASANTWTFGQNDDCPNLADKEIPLAFYCDYKTTIPWVDPVVAYRTQNSNRYPDNQRHTPPYEMTGHWDQGYNRGHNTQQGYSHRRTVTHRSGSTSGLSYDQGTHSQGAEECYIDVDCTIDVPCGEAWNPCVYGQAFRCRGTCNKYARCVEGAYRKETCHRNLSFDDGRMECTANRRCSSPRRNAHNPLAFVLESPAAKTNAKSNTRP